MKLKWSIFVSIGFIISTGATALRSGESVWEMPLEAGLWEKTEISGKKERYVDQLSGLSEHVTASDSLDFYKESGNGILKLSVRGNPPERSGGVLTLKLPSGLDLSPFRYCLVTCRARNLQRANTPIDLLVLNGEKRIPLLGSDEILCDGLDHTYLVKVELPARLDSAILSAYTNGSRASLEISSIRFLKECPARNDFFPDGWNGVQKIGEFRQADLTPFFNNSVENLFRRNLSRSEAVMDPLPLFSADKVSAFGIPFRVGPPGRNLITPADTSFARNEEIVEVFGLRVNRANYCPVSRDDLTSVEVNDHINEIFMILADDKPGSRSMKPYCIPPRPWTIESIEGFSADLEYADSSREVAFPYSLHAGGYAIQGMSGVYGIPADKSRKLKKIVLHNKMSGITVSLAAITFNLSDRKILPAELSAEPELIRVRPVPHIPAETPSVKEHNGIITMKNAFYEVVLDCRDGFAVRTIVNRFSPETQIRFAPDSGLETVAGNRTLSGKHFKTDKIIITGTTVQIHLMSKAVPLPLALTLSLKADEGPQITTLVQAENTGTKTFGADIRFPCFKDLTIGDLRDTWSFFPQYRNVLTDKMFFCKQPNHRGFLMQFMDVFNPRAGSGISLQTRNLGQEPVQYCMFKDEKGVTAYLENEGEDFPLVPGRPLEFCPRTIAFHGGDWHPAARIYADWVAGWYQPFRSQDKEWFKNAFFIKTYCVSPKEAVDIYRIPSPIVDPVSKKHLVDEMLSAEEKYMGMKPQLAHFYNWAFFEKTGNPSLGDYSVREYRNLGGLEQFRAMLQYLEKEKRIPVSLYTIWDRYSPGTDAGRKFGVSIASVRKGGEVQIFPDEVSVSVGVTAWKEHAVSNLARLARETGTNVLYLDVFATDDRAKSFASGRGHAVPSQTARDDAAFLKAIRKAIPAEVALWGEFPIPDVGSQYWDGFINYTPLFLHEYMAETLNTDGHAPLDTDLNMLPPDLFRFLFPKLRNVCFPVGNEGYTDGWRTLKFILFNGLALYDTTWRLFPENCRKKLSHSLKIMTEYPDCFNSETPEMFVSTLRAKVHANRFPGIKRTVWTLFNSRYTTVKGKILETPHKNGMRYFDLWNGVKIEPEIRDGKAVISLVLEPQQIGCILQTED